VSDTRRGRWAFGTGVADASGAVATKPLPASRRSAAAGHSRLLPADILVVGRRALPVKLAARLRRIQGVVAAIPVAAGRVRVDGAFVNVLGVNSAKFRWFAARPTARSNALWANVAAGGVAISFTMGSQDRLSLDEPVTVSGVHPMKLPVAGFGTVGIGGVDAGVSHTLARPPRLPRADPLAVTPPHAPLHRPPA